MPINERPHGARIRRKAAVVNALTPKPAAPQPEPEPEPEPEPSRRTGETSVGTCAPIRVHAYLTALDVAERAIAHAVTGGSSSAQRRGAPAAGRFSDQLIADLLGEGGGAVSAPDGRRPLRPSLTEQLSRATSGADQVLAQFGSDRKAKGLLYTAPAERFAVAECVSRQPSAMSFFDDRATYAFAHPLKGRVDMVMYYKDMIEPRVTRSQRLFTFRVKKTLRHFVDEYAPYNSAHRLSLCFKSMEGLEKFEQLVLERIVECSGKSARS